MRLVLFIAATRSKENTSTIVGFTFPSEESDKWELMYGVQGGDLIIYLGFDGWYFDRLSSTD